MKSGRRGNAATKTRPGAGAEAGRADTQDVLLAAVHRLMTEKDSIDVSLAEVAAMTGMSAALVQYHFGSKDGLLMALVERGAGKAAEQLAALETMDISAEKKLRMHVGGLLTAYVNAPYINRLLHLLMQTGDSERVRLISETFVKPIADFHRSVIEQGVREGVFRRVDPAHFYFILVGACDHIVARRGALKQVFNIDELSDDLRRSYASTVYELVRNGIAARR